MRHLAIAALCAAALLLGGCGSSEPPPPPAPPAPMDTLDLGETFEQGVVQVTDGVYVAMGFGLANAIMLEGDEGVVIVDGMESRPRAEAVLAAFREVTDKPVRALILTHNHADHVFGGLVFTETGEDIPVYAHASLDARLDEIVSVVRDTIYVRSMRMFGQLLPEHQMAGAGIGMDLSFRVEDIALARPTHTFADSLSLEIEGLRLELIHAPGETPDQIMIWLPEKRVLLPADNYYHAFPNLYTIRGTAYRDVMEWVQSLDKMRDLQAAYLVPSHTGPVVGEEVIESTLTAYRDAIQFVHDQTIRGLNQGKTANQLAEEITLPPHLAAKPFLQATYGAVPFSVRSICTGYLGWFDGDAAGLESLPPKQESRRLFEAFEKGVSLPEQARLALDEGDYRWAAQLARHWTRHETENDEAREILAKAFEALGNATTNFPARNYYLSQAAEWRGSLTIPPNDPRKSPDDFLASFPIERFLQAMAVRLKAEDALDADTVALFRFSDTDQEFTIHVRGGVAEIRERPHPQPDLIFTTTTETWKHLLTRKRNPLAAFATRAIRIEGGITAALRFLRYFEA